MYNQTNNVNIKPKIYLPEFHVSQNDVGRTLTAHLVSDEGEISIPGGATVTMAGTKPSGLGYTVTGTVDGPDVSFDTDAVMTDEPGRIVSEIRIVQGDTAIGTTNVVLSVEPNPHPDDTTDGRREPLINELTAILEDITEQIDRFSLETLAKVMVSDTASGAIASFTDGSDVLPAKSVLVTLNPKQDLHGYDRPWVGGAGKNLLGFRAINSTLNGVTFVSTGEKISITGTATASAFPYAGSESTKWATAQYGPYPAGQYTVEAKGFTPSVATDKIVFNAIYEDESGIEQFPNGVRISEGAVTFTASAPFKCGLWLYITSGSTINAPSVEVILNKGSAMKSWTPYSNICPISGRTEVVTQRTGKNILPSFSANSRTASGITFTQNADGTVTANGTATATVIWRETFAFSSGRYIVSGGLSGNNYVGIQNSDSAYVARSIGSDSSAFDLTGGTYYKTIRIGNGETVTNAVFKPMLRLSTETDATYEPYNGQTYTTSLGRTVYGGTLDVVSGVLTVDRAMITVNGTNYNMAMSGGSKRCYISDLSVPKAKPSPGTHAPAPNLIANYLTAVGDAEAYSGTVGVCVNATASANIGFTLTGNTMTLDEVKAYLAQNPLQVVYELATPTTIQCDPQTVQTLMGDNNVWGGSDVSIDYYADTKLYIEKMLGA